MTSPMVPGSSRPGLEPGDREGGDPAASTGDPGDPGDQGDRGGDGPATPAGRRTTDGAAVAAMVLGIIALVPFAVITGVIALFRTKGGRRGGKAMAVTGIVLAGVWTLAGGAVAAVLLTPVHHRTVVRPHPLRGTVFLLRTGQCIDTAPNGINTAHAVNCQQPHDAEIYATYRLTGRRWPGTAAIARKARSACASRFASYVNPQLAAALTESYVYPDRGAWGVGERTVICEVRSPTGRLTGSVRALGGT